MKIAILKNERGQSKGSAIVEFSSAQDAEYVVNALNGISLENRQIHFEYQKAPSTSGSGSGGFRGGKQQY